MSEPEGHRDAYSPPETPGAAGWVALLSGLLSFMFLWPQLGPLWLVGLAGMAWARRRPRMPRPLLYLLTLGSVLPGLWVGLAGKDAIGGFGVFLALTMMVTLADARPPGEHRVPFLLSFILLMAVGHKTLEIFYLVPVLLFFTGYALHRVGEGLEDPGELPWLRATSGLMLGSVLLAVPIFVLMPRTRLSVMAIGNRPSLSGFTGQVRFGEFLDIKLSDRLVMRVRTEEPTLLRGVTLDHFSGQEWRTTFMGTRTDAGADTPLLILEEELVGPGRAVDPGPEPPEGQASAPPTVRETAPILVQEVILEPFEQPVLFGASTPVAVWAPGKHVAATTAGNLVKLSHDARLEKLLYSVYSRRDGPTPEELAAVEEVVRRGRFDERYGQLPPDLPALVRARAEEITRGLGTVQEKAEAIQRWLKENFSYSLERDVDPDVDAVSDFLTGDPRGHCEYFATTMAIMLRTLGIYTRVVVGFAPGSYNPYAEMYSIRDADAHAWVDVYMGREHGWVEFDPTPPDPDHLAGEAEGSEFYLWLTAGMDNLDAWWQNNVVNYYYNEGGPGAESWLYRLDDFFVKTLGWRWLTRNPDELIALALRVFGVSVALIFAILAIRHGALRFGLSLRALLEWLRRLLGALFGSREPAASDRESAAGVGEARRLYLRWLEHQAGRGLPKHEAATPAEYLAWLTERDPTAAADGEVLTRAYQQEHYAERPGGPALELAREVADRLFAPGSRG